MNRAALVAAGAAGAIASLLVGAIGFVGLGIYDIGADDHHTKVVLAIIEQLRERSIVTRARGIVVPDLTDPGKIAAGGQRYAALCAECHLAPGVSKSMLRTGLYPHPPNLAQEEVLDAQHTFWVIKHGIKMSAMPAWGKTQDDAQIWELVAFLRQLPEMTPESYATVSGSGHLRETTSAPIDHPDSGGP